MHIKKNITMTSEVSKFENPATVFTTQLHHISPVLFLYFTKELRLTSINSLLELPFRFRKSVLLATGTYE